MCVCGIHGHECVSVCLWRPREVFRTLLSHSLCYCLDTRSVIELEAHCFDKVGQPVSSWHCLSSAGVIGPCSCVQLFTCIIGNSDLDSLPCIISGSGKSKIELVEG